MATTNTGPRNAGLKPSSKPARRAQQEYIEAWMRDDDIQRRERLHHIEYDC
ncbi:hypothetical protein [Synechococcus sp. BMK-MC-1]|uniref:hypothetical protein n=1 Tax=Synechococcus sp. BMK-MC-1 TaxID=1442551 RepID=UPI0016493187|nr:hypothetical protein [Synechococcus sp. BMK-MC-1]QNI68034.1 hypothetical protein SynBMKMC1_01963 [Synechococcus sp. BMK-MC-1]